MIQNKQSKSTTIDLLSMISDTQLTKEQKEDLALRAMQLTREDASVIWKDGRIECIKLNGSIKQIELTIIINKNGEVEIDGNKC